MLYPNKQLKEAGKDLFKALENDKDMEEVIKRITCTHIETSKTILRKRYLEEKTNENIADEMNMARATFYRNLDNAHMLVGLMMSKEYQNSVLSKTKKRDTI